MNDLISRTELLNNPPDICKDYDGIGIPKEGYTKEQIRNAPAVPAIPISVIEEIKAEITQMRTDYCGGYIGLNKQEVLEIIDKHIKEYET